MLMYEVLSDSPKEIFIIYIAVISAAICIYPLVQTILGSLKRGRVQ